MGVGDVVLRNDLQYERYDLISPRELARDFAAVPGLGDPTGFGDPTASLPTRPSEDPDDAGRARRAKRRRHRSSCIRSTNQSRSCAPSRSTRR